MGRPAGTWLAAMLLATSCSSPSGGGAPGVGGGAGASAPAGAGGGAGTSGTGGGAGAAGTSGAGASGRGGSAAGGDAGGATGGGGAGAGGDAGSAGAGGSTGGTAGAAGAAAGASGSGGRGGGAASGGASGRGGAAGGGGAGMGGTSGPGGRGGGGASGAGGSAPAIPIILSEDGGWCWFESPRALIQGNRLIIGTVASGWNDAARKGDINAIIHDLAAGTTTTFELHNQLELDDHDSPAFLARPDGRIVALFAKHGTENHFYYRTSSANNPATWAAEQTFTPTASTQLTYSNLFMLSAEQNRVYDFYRGLDASYKPSYAYSDDMGQTWRSGNVVINVPSTQLHRPYARYASNGTDTVHITYTEAHPRDFDNSIYHVYYKGGTLYRSDGTAIHTLAQGLSSPDEGTRIFRGDADNVAWTVDVALDPTSGRPHAVYSVQLGSAGLPTGQGGTDMRYRYARWDGAAWRDRPLAYAGTRLYSGEDDYTGLAVLDPTDASVVYIATNANPTTGAALMSTADGRRHYEIFRGDTTNAGDSWQWTPITSNSMLDNLRPIVVSDGDARKVLLWLRGTYRSYTDYQQQVLMLILAGGGS
jgi:hypothetical protein